MGTKNKNPFSVSSLIFLLCCLARFCYGVDIIRQGETMKDGDKLVSSDGVFELGFFSPENSRFRYVGIWYKVDTEAVVWVANRDKPMVNTNGVLRIGVDGNLVVLDGNGSSVWWSGVPSILSNTSFARLQKNGNLELSNDTREVIWDSFHHPTDTFLPGMKLPVSLSMGEVRCFRSWRSAIDPSYGNYSVGTIANGGPQIVIWDQNGRRRWRSGQWNGVTFTGISNLSDTASFLHGFKLSEHDDNGTRYFTYEPSNSSALSRFHIRYDGTFHQWCVARTRMRSFSMSLSPAARNFQQYASAVLSYTLGFCHESTVFFEYPTDLSSLCCVAKRLVYRETWGRRTETRVDSERDNSYRLF
ncbi:hypothetical protein PVK06_021931 [Gossypium arboreum]|uniref:Bulb-type lectin domain-containing protein n=1 Tax=Gossypium arboreum TaxID=29729 RepID=A0ABR0PRE0_GOSAR|nr:hypothetical protein PVK06_021931 [Gossypium arboreum]